jgi:hypothetical protein
VGFGFGAGLGDGAGLGVGAGLGLGVGAGVGVVVVFDGFATGPLTTIGTVGLRARLVSVGVGAAGCSRPVQDETTSTAAKILKNRGAR